MPSLFLLAAFHPFYFTFYFNYLSGVISVKNHLSQSKVSPWVWISALLLLGSATTVFFLWEARPQAASTAPAHQSGSTSAQPGQADGKLVVAGSGTNLSITRTLAKAFEQSRPGLRIDVPPSIGSKGGIQAVAEGAITLGLASRPLKEKELVLGISAVPYAKTAVVIGVHPSVRNNDITFEELVSIYRGAKTLWQNGQEIIVLSREPGDSSNEVLAQQVPGYQSAYEQSQQAKRWTTLFTDQDANKALASTQYAVGLSDLGAITTEQLPIKPLKVNGIVPTLENLQTGQYPLVKTLFFVLPRAELPVDAQAFLDFVGSNEGAKILRTNGYLPLSQP